MEGEDGYEWGFSPSSDRGSDAMAVAVEARSSVISTRRGLDDLIRLRWLFDVSVSDNRDNRFAFSPQHKTPDDRLFFGAGFFLL